MEDNKWIYVSGLQFAPKIDAADLTSAADFTDAAISVSDSEMAIGRRKVIKAYQNINNVIVELTIHIGK